MKKIVILTMVMVFMFGVALAKAIPTNDTNIALNIAKSERSTFTNTGGMFDGVISSEPQFSAKSGDIYQKVQEAYVPLPKPFYVRQIKIYWDKTSYYPEYSLQISDDGTNLWEVDAATRKDEVRAKSIVHTYTLPGALVNAIRLVVRGDRKDAVKKGPVIVQEIEIFPQMDDRVQIERTEVIFGDTDALVLPQTNLQSSVRFKYKESGSTQNYTVGGYGRLREAATAVGLKPGTRYDYFVETEDFNANIIAGKVDQFTTRPLSLADAAVVSGSFSVAGGEPSILVTGPLNEPASSGSIYDRDQMLVLDIGDVRPMNTVVVYWSRLAYSQDYSVLGSVDGVKWEVLAKNIDATKGLQGRTRGSSGGSPMNVVETRFKDNSYRFIKILIAKDSDFYHKHTNWDYVQMFKVKVF